MQHNSGRIHRENFPAKGSHSLKQKQIKNQTKQNTQKQTSNQRPHKDLQ
jgi:hypothetical protein